METCVESGLLFDCAARPWYIEEIKMLHSWIDKRYRSVWSNNKAPPLIQMEAEGKNMQDVRKILGVKSLRWKIEKRTLERIGHILRMSDERPVKIAVMGWLGSLEGLPKTPGKKRKTLFYWRKLLTEAGIDWRQAHKWAQDRKQWKAMVRKRMQHLEEWERKTANKFRFADKRERNEKPPTPSLESDECVLVCKTAAGLKCHVKRIHEQTKTVFSCEKCDSTFKMLSNYQNHIKKCNPRIPRTTKTVIKPPKWCDYCNEYKSASNFARHVRKCSSATGGHAE